MQVHNKKSTIYHKQKSTLKILHKQKPTHKVLRKQKPYTQEAAYAMNTHEIANIYERTFEARLPTFNEAAEIAKEKKKLMDKYYVNKKQFLL